MGHDGLVLGLHLRGILAWWSHLLQDCVKKAGVESSLGELLPSEKAN